MKCGYVLKTTLIENHADYENEMARLWYDLQDLGSVDKRCTAVVNGVLVLEEEEHMPHKYSNELCYSTETLEFIAISISKLEVNIYS